MRKIAFILLSLIVLLVCNINPVMSQWRGPNRNGVYPEKGLLQKWPDNGPGLLWSFDKLGIGYTSAAVTSDNVFITGIIDSIGYLYSFDNSGKLLWKKDYGPDWMLEFPGTRTTPLINAGNIYLLSGYGVLYCLSEKNGSIVWKKNISVDYEGKIPDQGFAENLIIDGDKLFCTPGGADANVVALNKMNGEVIWLSKGNREQSAYCSPLLIEHGGKKFFITMTAKSVISINTENGELAWRYGDLTYQYPDHPNTPIYQNGFLFAIDGGNGGSVMLKIADNGYSVTEVWKSAVIDQVMGNALLLNNRLYTASSGKKQWFCIDWNTGKEIFSNQMLTRGSVISADGMLYCYTFIGEVGLVKPTDNGFELVSSFKVPGGPKEHWAHPVINNGRLFIRFHDSLWVYNIKK